MSSKQADAVSKINAEMSANKNNSYVQAVGGFLLQHLEGHSDFAESVLAESKSILKSLDAMRKVAEKKKTGNFAVLTGEEGFVIVLDYFKSAEPAPKKPAAEKPKKPEKEKPQNEQVQQDDDDDIDFDALLL